MSEKITAEKHKLGLHLPTDPRWVNLAEMDIREILVDHAYCEQKAASSCITLVQRYPELKRLVEEVSPVVTEEWGHFRLVLAELNKRGYELGPQRKDEYVAKLQDFHIKGGDRHKRLLDSLLICALIEARSCERFRLLSLHISDDDLKEFYRKFMISEAGHYRMFLDLAYHYANDSSYVDQRWQEFLNYEKDILSKMELRADRMH